MNTRLVHASTLLSPGEPVECYPVGMCRGSRMGCVSLWVLLTLLSGCGKPSQEPDPTPDLAADPCNFGCPAILPFCLPEEHRCVASLHDADCGAGMLCIDEHCATCRRDTDCGPGGVCRDGRCITSCSGAGGGCDAGTCNVDLGMCVFCAHD